MEISNGEMDKMTFAPEQQKDMMVISTHHLYRVEMEVYKNMYILAFEERFSTRNAAESYLTKNPLDKPFRIVMEKGAFIKFGSDAPSQWYPIYGQGHNVHSSISYDAKTGELWKQNEKRAELTIEVLGDKSRLVTIHSCCDAVKVLITKEGIVSVE